MALPANPSRDDIFQEFAPNTQPSNSLLSMNNVIFGTGNSYSRDQFGGTGQPSGLDNQAPTNVGTTSATFNGSVADVGGILTRVFWEYSKQSDFSTIAGQTGTDTTSTDGASVSQGETGLDPSTTYYCRIVAYNAYCDGDPADYVTNTSDVISFTTDSACANPTNVSSTHSFGTVTISWDSSYDPANGWEIQYRVNGGNWNVEVDGLGGSNRSYDHDACAEANVSDGDLVEHRIKAQCSGSESDWILSDTVQVSCF